MNRKYVSIPIEIWNLGELHPNERVLLAEVASFEDKNKKHEMIWQELTYDEMCTAYKMSQELPPEMKGNYSGNNPLKRFAGYVGQVAAHKYFKGSENVDAFDFDILFEGLRVEIKTSCRSVPPLDTYIARVAGSNSSQLCDVYVFASAQCNNGKFSHGCWLVGWITKEQMLSSMWFTAKGTKATDGFTEKGDCFKMLISDLRPMTSLKALNKK